MKLREYQNNIAIRAANKLTAFGCCYLSMECRTGKTLTALYAADKFNAKRVLFITKLKAIPSVKTTISHYNHLLSWKLSILKAATR